ncbi:VOC family protein [Sphingomonas sp. GlSt437]|uniref:VOC family protein n=1 Tax=Sphingomonas sp. GlSt437 TaxID=3389970 RepID=UPI003A8A3378
MTDFLTHGRIIGGTATVPDLDLALADYRDRLGLRVVEQGTIPADLAASWGCPATAGARYAALQPLSATPCTVRLVEQPLPADFVPTTTFGWAAFEINVQDVFGWPDRLAGSGFDIIGEPKEIPGLPYFVAMQMLGRGKEMIYLNEVRSDTPTSDLPRAQSPVDRIFITILATPDRAATLGWYQRHLGLEEGGSYTIPYTMISRAFGLPADTLHSLSMAQIGRMPIVEIDDYPAQATARPRLPGRLPPGNAMVTLAVDTLDDRGLEFLAPPSSRDGPVYGGRRVATVIGSAGELIELVEI